MRRAGTALIHKQPLLMHACPMLNGLVGTQVIPAGLIGAEGKGPPPQKPPPGARLLTVRYRCTPHPLTGVQCCSHLVRWRAERPP
jgi:hypothetical protein